MRGMGKLGDLMRGQEESFFDAMASRYDRDFARPMPLLRARLEKYARSWGPGARVLDLGIGTGLELPWLQEHGCTVTGLDFSERMLARCMKRGRDVQLVRADVWSAWPVATQSFDVVLALFGTLAHPPREEEVLIRLAEEVARALVPGGIFISELPTQVWLDAAVLEPGPLSVSALGGGRFRCTGANVAEIDGRVFDEAGWRRAFGQHFQCEIMTHDAHEIAWMARLTPPKGVTIGRYATSTLVR